MVTVLPVWAYVSVYPSTAVMYALVPIQRVRIEDGLAGREATAVR